jgi:UDP-glucose 4-epimerase
MIGPMRALVTGHDGFIGTHLCAALDGRHRAETQELLRSRSIAKSDADVIFHLAAQADVAASIDDPVVDAHTNIIGTVNVLLAAERMGAQVVFASSAAAMVPASPYGVSKRAGELYCGISSADTTVLRIANVYGPGGRGVIAKFADAARRGEPAVIYGDGLQTRDYIHVEDVVRAMIHVAENRLTGAFNVGTGVETSVLALAYMLELKTRHAPGLDGEVRRSCLPPTVPGWTPQISLKRALDVRVAN